MQQKVIPSRNIAGRSGNWIINDNGVFLNDVQVSTEPVTVMAVIVENGFYRLEVTFPSLNGRSIIAPRADFLTSRKIRKTGVPLFSGNRRAALMMTGYISDMERLARKVRIEDGVPILVRAAKDVWTVKEARTAQD